ncbi:MAG TPA: riboflavin synthase, partial [Sediminispirochaeta sp.]|nr:riboflavin synthase [Sediminispirochaeta sp.]
MFTGLVEEVGTVTRLHRRGEYQELRIEARKVLEDLEKGDSIAINGVCQTAVKIDESSFTVETLAVSLR